MLGFLYPKHVEIIFEDSNREFRTARYLNKKPEIQLGVEYCFSGCVLMSISRQLKNRTFGTFVTSKKHHVFLVLSQCRFQEGNNIKKTKNTTRDSRRTLMYSSTCFAASKPKLTACGVRSPGILGSIMALWQFQHHSLYHSPNHERPSCPKNVASVFL